MAMSFQNSPDPPLNFHKFKKTPKNLLNPKKNNPKDLKSFWAFLSSIFIYISIFYIFNLSPSTLFGSTKFWFFISNTLVLIIAADYVSFSSSKNHDYYDEYVEKSSKSPSFDYKIFPKTKIYSHINDDEKPNEKIINMVEDQIREDEHEILRIKEKDESDPNPDQESGEKVTGPKWARSKSDVVSVAEGREGEVVLQRAFSEIHDYEEERLDDENEFSRMSNEELNGRVEEFIRRFNRQIRLQAVVTN